MKMINLRNALFGRRIVLVVCLGFLIVPFLFILNDPTHDGEKMREFYLLFGGFAAFCLLIGYGLWEWLMRGKRLNDDCRTVADFLRHYRTAWARTFDFRSADATGAFTGICLISSVLLALGPFIGLLTAALIDRLLASDELAWLVGYVATWTLALPVPAFVCRRLHAANRSAWWSIPLLVLAQLGVTMPIMIYAMFDLIRLGK